MGPIKEGDAHTKRVFKIQQILKRLGHYHGTVDGLYGPLTTAAVRTFQEVQFVTGQVDAHTFEALLQIRQEWEHPQSTTLDHSLTAEQKQIFLQEKGYYYGAIDGEYGPFSQKAEEDFCKAHRIESQKAFIEKLQQPDYPGVTPAFLRVGQYFQTVSAKKQIVIHHTAGSGSAWNTKQWWDMHPAQVATDFIIDADGSILRVIPKGYWAWHLGVGRMDLDSRAIGIELCNYGFLVKAGNTYHNDYGGIVPPERVYTLKEQWKGHWYFEKYTPQQLQSLYGLLKCLVEEYGINFDKNTFHDGKSGVFDWSRDAMNGREGIYTHNSYLLYKTDAYPHHELIDLLQAL
ncbi:peptidoglycan recognition protein family protein [Eisenibacter elegans]|uniref:peptidoglycan recognition protein family protein n=1 Tax=Eisenibacter elegans TaxID=997 RepID=UPI0004209605|nr:N-acetylmuramoyl-L-alanine amidase [Eisenibacter elegans]